MLAVPRSNFIACASLVALLSGFLLPATGSEPPVREMAMYSLQADGLACPFCAYGIEKQLFRITGVKTVATNVATGTIVITMFLGASLEESDAQRAVEAAGFSMRNFKKMSDAA